VLFLNFGLENIVLSRYEKRKQKKIEENGIDWERLGYKVKSGKEKRG
jgi:hypothetical protein